MEENIFGDKKYAYAFYALSIVLVLSSALLYSKLLAFAIIAIVLSVIYFHSGSLINAAILKKRKMLVMSSGYSLGKNLVSAIKKIGDSYSSTSIAILYMDHTPQSEGDLFEAFLEKVDTPFEFSMSLEPFDKKKAMESLQTQRSIKEIQLSHLSEKDHAKASRLKREIAFMENEMSQLSNGSKPMTVAFKLKCSAIAPAEMEAARESAIRLEKVAQALASTFDARYTVLKGEDLLKNL